MKNPDPRLVIAFVALMSSFFPISGVADGPADNIPEQVRPVPPVGIEVPEAKALPIREKLELLKKSISSLKQQKDHAERVEAYLPDIEVCFRAANDALEFGEFFNPKEIDWAIELLEIGMERASQLSQGETPWTKQKGNVIRGYRSRIDGSPQPYGLEIPESYDFGGNVPVRLDFWFHGRGEKLSENAFLMQRHQGRGGKISPADAIVLHPYGRYSNANKFAGEADLFEALEHAQKDYRIDQDRLFVRGFSMGGAACWQFAVHFADRWAGAQPGAGFSETPDFLKTFQGETLSPTWWEEKLWRWYDATEWAMNLSNTSTIAYSGEIDRQKQAADMMVKACEKAGLRLVHLIGPETAHALHPDSLAEIEKRLANIAKSGRKRAPQRVRFITYTLRYDQMHWVRVKRLTEHWEPATVDARWEWPNRIIVETSGVEELSLEFPAGDCPLDLSKKPLIEIDGSELEGPGIFTDRSWNVSLSRGDAGKDGAWKISRSTENSGQLVKRHGLQGPVDDAFTDSFLMVAPTGEPMNEKLGQWAKAEMQHAIEHWRLQFRGHARVKSDQDISEDDIANHNLILWGDPQSNDLIRRIVGELPVSWNEEHIVAGKSSFPAGQHALVLIYPNPLNPERYVVLNSGFTYREYDYLNNARQTPKLPDWAVIDLSQPVTTRWPGGIPVAGFFGEDWEFVEPPEK